MIAQILIVDDDEKICQLIARLLRRDGYDVTYAINVQQALDVAKYFIFDLIITDVMMPHIDGKQFTDMLRHGKTSFHKEISIIMVSALYETHDRIEGIRKGSDDYLVKPFEPEELLVRIKALLRRNPPQRKQNVKIIDDKYGCILDIENAKMIIQFNQIGLSDKEVLFLKILMQNLDTVVSKHEITRQIYPEYVHSPLSRTAEVMIGRLRKKLEDNNCKKVKTKRGYGYYWQP